MALCTVIGDALVYVVPAPYCFQTPDSDLNTEHGYIAPQLYSNPEIEEVVVLTLTGHAFMKNFGLFLGNALESCMYHNSMNLVTMSDIIHLITCL